MSFPQKLVLWLHVAFVAFTIGPVTLAIMSTPRYIRHRDVRIVRYLNRITFIFALGTLGVLIAGFALASMISVDGQAWVIVSATLFIVALLLIGLIMRDQRKAIKALAEAVTAPSSQVAADDQPQAPADSQLAPDPDVDEAAGQGSAATTSVATASPAIASHVAAVERGRIAMMGGVVSLIWLVILVLMVWH
jgi:hypothetical protein